MLKFSVTLTLSNVTVTANHQPCPLRTILATGDSCRGNSLPGVQSEPNSIRFPQIALLKTTVCGLLVVWSPTCRSNGATNPPFRKSKLQVQVNCSCPVTHCQSLSVVVCRSFCCAYDWGVSGKTPPEPDEAASSGRSMTLACVPANINQYWISTLTSLRNAYLPKSPPPDRDNPIFQGTFESSVIILVFFHFGALDPENRPTLPRRPQKPSQRRDQIPRLSISLVLCYASSFDRQPGPAQHSHDLKCGP